GDLAPRDRVSRALLREMERTGAPVYLSLRHMARDVVHAHFPSIADAVRRAGLDLARDRIPVSPAAHYVMGGVETDLEGRTSIPGLFAAGEVACTGVHGANRLASNSLLEGLVFGLRAGCAMRDLRASEWQPRFGSTLAARAGTGTGAPAVATPWTADQGRDVMWGWGGGFCGGSGLPECLFLVGPRGGGGAGPARAPAAAACRPRRGRA